MSLFRIFRKETITLLIVGAVFAAACTQEEPTGGPPEETVIVFKHGKVPGDPAALRGLLDRFEREHPGIRIKDETLPSNTDEQHQFYAVNLEGGSRDFDVFSLDVIWVPEFARAGWLRDVSRLFPPEEQKEFFPGPVEAVVFENRPYAVPWYIDAGVLYYRSDLLEKYGRPVPKNWQELVSTAREITDREQGIYGYVWQGKQYEGLVCNVLEFLWSNGGDVLSRGRPVLTSPQNREALSFMRDLIVKYGVTPPLVTTAIEEPTRQIFGSGRAVFLRNWPYAWTIFNRSNSAVKGKVGMAELPSFAGNESASTLGGWQLGINRHSRHPEASEKFVRFMTSTAVQKEMALSVGYKPTRRSLYKDPDLIRKQPDFKMLYPILLKARPRPVTPYYMMITGVLQPEFSAAISGIRTPAEALTSAQKQVSYILEAER